MKEDKKLQEIAGLRQQIAGLQESESALKENLKMLLSDVELLDAVLSALADPLFVMTREGKILYTNAASERIFGVDRSKAIGKAWQSIGLPADMVGTLTTVVETGSASGQQVVKGVTATLPIGQCIYEYTVSQINVPTSHMEAVAISVHDVTERQQLEKVAREHERALDALNRVIVAGNQVETFSIFLDTVLTIIVELLQFDVGTIDLLLDGFDVEEHHHTKYHTNASEEVRQIVNNRKVQKASSDRQPVFVSVPMAASEPDSESGEIITARIPLLSKDQTIGEFTLYSMPPRTFSQEEQNILTAIGREVTTAIMRIRAEAILKKVHEELEQKVRERTEELASVNRELKKTNERLQRSNQELEQFAYVASHDLQEPLRMVSSYVQILKEDYHGKLDTEADEFIDFAVDGALRMQALINDLLTFSRVSSRGKPLKQTSSEAALREALENLTVAVNESDAIVTHDQLPDVKADSTQLTQLFQNLISNAIKFKSDARPKITIGVAPTEGAWRFSVKDNGIGIDMRYADRVFVIFQRLNPRGEHPGTGIGLAICKKIVERHGGNIWVESEPGKGSTFYFTLPKKSIKGIKSL